MNFKKRVNGSWTDTPHYIHKTDTDILTTLPAVLYPTDSTATVGLKGQTVQTGTPTPDSPVMPQGTGERTGNLFDKNATNVNNGYITNGLLQSDGIITTNINYRVSEYIRIAQNQSYALFYGSNLNLPSVCFYDSAKNYISGIAYAGRWSVPFTTPQNAEYLRLSFRAADPALIMLNTGSAALPYEPYGYKIPISSANATTPVYLGEVQTTRKIRKLVLTGEEETWDTISGNAPYRIQLPDIVQTSDKNIVLFTSSHYRAVSNNAFGDRYTTCVSWTFSGGVNVKCLVFRDRNQATLADFKAYLAQQYAAGTPVTVWYVLAEPETAVVNEPLMKIGDYADIVSDISVPVTAGGDTISVDATVQPSGVAINYKGWHNAKCKEYSYNMTIADWESASISQMENHTIQELQGGNWV